MKAQVSEQYEVDLVEFLTKDFEYSYTEWVAACFNIRHDKKYRMNKCSWQVKIETKIDFLFSVRI